MPAQETAPAQETDFFQRKPLKEEVFEYLHKSIIAGKYAPGEWLRQEEISSRLGVSQTPVREALDLLVSAGLAEREPYRGVRVLQLSQDEIIDAYTLRLLLESAAARIAARNRTHAQVENLAHIVEETKSLMTLSEMSTQRQLNREFHILLVEASRNTLFSKMYALVCNQFPDWMLYEYMFRHPELLESSLIKEYQEHKAIVAALAAGDSEMTARHVVLHIRNLGKELVSFLGISESVLQSREELLGPFLVND